jgi:hypothetical protein
VAQVFLWGTKKNVLPGTPQIVTVFGIQIFSGKKIFYDAHG